MGLLKVTKNAVGSVFADAWKEYFYCEALSSHVLVSRGFKRKSNNNKGNDNIITDGSIIAVADGQCMIIVDQGKIVEVCSEPGEYTYDISTEPSIFTSNLESAIQQTFDSIGKRITFGADTGKDQRVYFINTKENMDNKFGTSNPIPFRIVDTNIGLDTDVSVRCSGVYSYRISNPLLFYTNVCGNIKDQFTRDQIDKQLKTEFISALQPAFAKISQTGVRPSELPAHVEELSQAMNEALTSKWSSLRGISIVSIAMNPITLSDQDAQWIKQAQRSAMLKDPTMAAATLVEAQADAMKTAAGNSNGAFTGFMGMNMASQQGINVQSLYQSPKPEKQENEWICTCGAKSTGKFCPQCGAAKPVSIGWTCPNCKTINKGKFCMECGTKKPANEPLYRCDKCGWEPEDPKNPPKFCPQCGDPFDENDIV